MLRITAALCGFLVRTACGGGGGGGSDTKANGDGNGITPNSVLMSDILFGGRGVWREVTVE